MLPLPLGASASAAHFSRRVSQAGIASRERVASSQPLVHCAIGCAVLSAVPPTVAPIRRRKDRRSLDVQHARVARGGSPRQALGDRRNKDLCALLVHASISSACMSRWHFASTFSVPADPCSGYHARTRSNLLCFLYLSLLSRALGACRPQKNTTAPVILPSSAQKHSYPGTTCSHIRSSPPTTHSSHLLRLAVHSTPLPLSFATIPTRPLRSSRVARVPPRIWSHSFHWRVFVPCLLYKKHGRQELFGTPRVIVKRRA